MRIDVWSLWGQGRRKSSGQNSPHRRDIKYFGYLRKAKCPTGYGGCLQQISHGSKVGGETL